MGKYEILTELLSRFYGGDYKSIKRTQKEEVDSYRITFGEDISLTVNTSADCVYMNVAFKEANALAFLSDVIKRYADDKRKEKYEKAKEKLLKAKEELEKLEEEMKEECD